MLHSRATAALERLKEMDRKYKIKLKEGKLNRNNVSTESSLESTPKSNSSRVEYIQTSKKEIASKVSPKFKKTASPGEKFSDDEVHSKKSSKTSPKEKVQLSSEIEANKESASRTEESVKTVSNPEDTLKSSSEIRDVISGSEDPQGQDEESVATIFSRQTAETISEAIKPRNGNNVMEKVTTEDNLEAFNPGNDETTIDEVIEKSETISELPSALDKDNIEGEDSSSASFADEQKLQYENTFEEATNSTTSSSSVRSQKSSEEALPQDTLISGVKQIKITSHKQEIVEEKVVDEEKDKEIVELIAPKIIKSNSVCDVDLDEELSNYVKTTENVDEVTPINLLRLSKQTTPTKKHVRKNKKHRKSSNENVKEKTDSFSDDQRLTESKVHDGLPLKENSSSTTMKSASSARKVQKESPKAEMASLSSEQAQVESVEVEKEAAKSETEKLMREPENISSEKLLRETPKKSDVTSTLRELNKDAINAIVRKHRIHATRKISDKSRRCKNCQAVVKLPSVEYEESENIEDESLTSQENIRTHSSHHQKMKVKRGKSKRISKACKSRKVNQEKIEEQSRFCRQTRHLQKQAAILRMQQEREDIRNYLLELQFTQLEFGPGETSSKIAAFKPLEFPKILGYKRPDIESSNLLATDAIAMLQEKVSTIRQWLKDQYLLYRDYSKLAQTVNAKYVPASLEDAKKTIRQLQRATI